MSYLLDTNIISEIIRKKPDANVIHYLHAIPSEELYLSVLTLGELRKGVEKLNDGQKRNKLRLWLEQDLFASFADRILPINHEIADRWGYIAAMLPRSLPAVDVLLSATALTHNLKLVTRNVKDFEIPGLEVVNPFLF